MNAGLVSIVIVNYNGADILGRCLDGVHAQSYRPIEVIVVDNHSTDDSIERMRGRFPQVRVVECERNLGFAGGNNRGVAVAQGEYVVLLNNDTVVDALWLINLVAMMQQADIGAVTSKVVTDGVPSEFYEQNGTINYLGYNIMREFSDLSQVFFASGASLMFRREEVGRPFLDEYFIYQEDVFLSWKIRLLGKTVAMAQQSVVHHTGSVTVRQQSSSLVTFFQERNRLLNALLFYEARTLLLLIPYFVFDGVAKLLLSVVSKRKSLSGIVQSYWWLTTHTSWINRERSNLQSRRRVQDKHIMNLMSHRIIDGRSLPASFLNGVSKVYARVAGLGYHD